MSSLLRPHVMLSWQKRTVLHLSRVSYSAKAAASSPQPPATLPTPPTPHKLPVAPVPPKRVSIANLHKWAKQDRPIVMVCDEHLFLRGFYH